MAEKCSISPDWLSLLCRITQESRALCSLRKQRQGIESQVHCGCCWYPHDPGPWSLENLQFWALVPCAEQNSSMGLPLARGLGRGAERRSSRSRSPSKLPPPHPQIHFPLPNTERLTLPQLDSRRTSIIDLMSIDFYERWSLSSFGFQPYKHPCGLWFGFEDR